MSEIKQPNESSFTNGEMQTNQIQRALGILQRAQRYDLQQRNYSETLVRSNNGDWVEWDNVLEAIEILKDQQK